METELEMMTRILTSSASRGSVFGPTLWNLLYDYILIMDMLEEVALEDFADKIAMVIVEHGRMLINTANSGLQIVTEWKT